jgi:tetratricopeptide (TPR) repeat protein
LQLLRRAAPLFLLGFAVPSLALTLGQPQGAVWIGRPLDLVVPLTLAEGEGGDVLCAEAEMVQGGVRVDDRRVTVSLEPGGRPGQTRIHIRSTMPVEEPVVQVTVRAGCQASSSRQFVLLADMPVELTAAPVLPAASGASSSGTTNAPVTRSNRRPERAIGDGSGSAATSPTAPPQRAATPRPRPAASAERGEARAPAARATPPVRRSTTATPARAPVPAVPPTAAAAAPTVPPAGSPSASGGARLQLDLLDPSAARNPALAASAAAAAGAPDPAVSAALAAASAAANAEELQRANERMKALEATLAALREQSAQNQRLLLEMRTELAEARDSRYRNPLVYALCVLLLLALIGLFMLWRVARRTTGPAWWGDTTGKDDGPSLPPASAALSAGLAGASVAESSAAPKTGPFGTPLLAADTEDDAPDTLPPLVEDESAPARYVNTEELFDVQQQSDFFLSLGQHEQAIAVLSEHIADNPETSALAYLDLLRIYHGLDRRDDYARVGQEFERAFNASVPDFEHFSEVGHGLEHYRSTLARIEAQWPRQGTLALIEELVFRKPGTRGDESFDLAAYRELLLLYSVAKEVIDPDSAPPTPVTPLSFLDTHEAKLEPTRPADLDRATEQLGLTGRDHNAPDAPLPSLYGAIDETLSHDTVIAAHPGAASARPAASASTSSHEEEPQTRPMSVNERQERPDQSAAMAFDNTSLETLETLPAELELEKRPSSPPTTDDMPLPELRLDLELFDPAIEAEIAPRPRRRR